MTEASEPCRERAFTNGFSLYKIESKRPEREFSAWALSTAANRITQENNQCRRQNFSAPWFKNNGLENPDERRSGDIKRFFNTTRKRSGIGSRAYP